MNRFQCEEEEEAEEERNFECYSRVANFVPVLLVIRIPSQNSCSYIQKFSKSVLYFPVTVQFKELRVQNFETWLFFPSDMSHRKSRFCLLLKSVGMIISFS